MKQQENARNGRYNADETVVCRRVVMRSAGVAFLGVLAGSTFGRENAGRGERPGMPMDVQNRMEQSRVFFERMRDATSDGERAKIMEERQAWDRTRAVEDFGGQLEVADQEWVVIKPRIEAVYNLLHPQPSFGRGDTQPASPVERSRSELRQLLNDKGVAADQIKAKLTALRTAKEKVRQELAKARQQLRQLMTIRQEAVLVLSDLLD